MAWNATTYKLTKPFTIAELTVNALGWSATARPFTATAIFTAASINMWSKRKPVASSALTGPIDMAAAAYGLTVQKAATLADIITQGRTFTTDSNRRVGAISYAPPASGPRRWSDWNGYSNYVTSKPWTVTIAVNNGTVNVFFQPMLLIEDTGDIMMMPEVAAACGTAAGVNALTSVGVAYCLATGATSGAVMQTDPSAGAISMIDGGVTSFNLTEGIWNVVLFFGRLQFGVPYVVFHSQNVTVESTKTRVFINLEGQFSGSRVYQVRIHAVYADTFTDYYMPTYGYCDITRQPDAGGMVFANFEIEAGNSYSQWYSYFAMTGRIEIANFTPSTYGDAVFTIGTGNIEW